MPYKDPEKQRAYYQIRHMKNKVEDNERDRAYYQQHRVSLIAASRRYQQEHVVQGNKARVILAEHKKLLVMEHYSTTHPPSCALCGITDIDVLCVDHINNDGNEQRRKLGLRGGNIFYRWLINQDFPEGYQVLCFNCNFKKDICRRRGAK